MAESRHITNKVAEYLGGLSPGAREMLLKRLEDSKAKGQLDPTARMVLDAARSTVAGEAKVPAPPAAKQPAPRQAASRSASAQGASRAPLPEQPIEVSFFAPYQPFAIDEDLPQRLPGRLTAASFPLIWAFIARDVAPELLKPWADGRIPNRVSNVMELEGAVEDLRRAIFVRARKTVAQADESPRAQQRIAGQIGGERAFLDFRDILELDGRRNALATTLRAVPEAEAFDAAGERQAGQVIQRHLDNNARDAIWIASAMAARPSSLLFLPKLAVMLAGSDDPAHIRSGSGRAFLDAAVGELHRLAYRFVEAFGDRRRLDDAMQTLRLFHELSRMIVGVVAIDSDESWRQQIASERRVLSDRIRRELETAVAVTRGALTPANAPGLSLDAKRADVDDAVRLVTLLFHVRRYKETLALNEVATRLVAGVEHAVEVASTKLMAELAQAAGDRRTTVLAACDSAAELAALVFGEEYATQMRRRQQAAARGAA